MEEILEDNKHACVAFITCKQQSSKGYETKVPNVYLSEGNVHPATDAAQTHYCACWGEEVSIDRHAGDDSPTPKPENLLQPVNERSQ